MLAESGEMPARHVRISLDNVGCLSVVVLAVAFHWVLASRLGLSGFFSGAIAWGVAFVAGLAIVARIVSRSARARLVPKPAQRTRSFSAH